jgi:hypothetical protein
MTEIEKDILQNPELKINPYSTPEGYFDSFKIEARKCTKPRHVRLDIWNRLAPYAGIAAMFLFILLLGKIFIRPESPSVTAVAETDTYEDYILFSGMDADISMQYLAEESLELNEEDIIEYLIYIGATEEYIESNKE